MYVSILNKGCDRYADARTGMRRKAAYGSSEIAPVSSAKLMHVRAMSHAVNNHEQALFIQIPFWLFVGTWKCQGHHELSGLPVLSGTRGKLVLADFFDKCRTIVDGILVVTVDGLEVTIDVLVDGVRLTSKYSVWCNWVLAETWGVLVLLPVLRSDPALLLMNSCPPSYVSYNKWNF